MEAHCGAFCNVLIRSFQADRVRAVSSKNWDLGAFPISRLMQSMDINWPLQNAYQPLEPSHAKTHPKATSQNHPPVSPPLPSGNPGCQPILLIQSQDLRKSSGTQRGVVDNAFCIQSKFLKPFFS